MRRDKIMHLARARLASLQFNFIAYNTSRFKKHEFSVSGLPALSVKVEVSFRLHYVCRRGVSGR